MEKNEERVRVFGSAIGIPSGLNPIKTCRNLKEASKSCDEEDLNVTEDIGSDASISGSRSYKSTLDHKNHGKFRQGFHKGRRFARWFTLYPSKDANEALSLENKMVSKKRTKYHMDFKRLSRLRSLADGRHGRKAPKQTKRFSSDIGSRGDIQPKHQAQSYDELKVLIGLLCSRFDAAKDVVNVELESFSNGILEALEKKGSVSLSSDFDTMMDLSNLARKCIDMPSSEFRRTCEKTVQNLSERRKLSQSGLVQELLTDMLFILTRCTRLLQVEKDTGPITEDSLQKFRHCLASVPTVETECVSKKLKPDFNFDSTFTDKNIVECISNKFTEADWPRTEKHSEVPKKKSPSYVSQVKVNSISESYFHQLSSLQSKKATSLQEDAVASDYLTSLERGVDEGEFDDKEQLFDNSDMVMCRICEKQVPTSHLECHSYICAYADKCDLKGFDVDDRLSKVAEILEQIRESYSPNFVAFDRNLDETNEQVSDSGVSSVYHSPKVNEWHNKGVEGMFEDLHEMDTASLDDCPLPISNNFNAQLIMKHGHSLAPSSTESPSSVSSTNTPRSCHFDLFWLEYNNPSEPEDMQQVSDLVHIAVDVARVDLEKEDAVENLSSCMNNLKDVLKHNKLKGLVIDTLGNRIESLLREKYLLACELRNRRCQEETDERGSEFLIDFKEGTAILHPPLKERIGIDDFEVIKPISRGAFGQVFLARKRTTGDLFAMKVLKKLDMIRKNDIERILAERNILITVRNPFVVRFFYSFTSSDNIYLVMEYLNGGDLYSLLRKVGCLDEDVARGYIAQLVLALEYLHSLGIVHRDLKPDNILIAHDGHIKLTDFGLSKIGLVNNTADLSDSGANYTPISDSSIGNPVENIHERQTNNRHSAVGTPDYLAPEILLGTEHGCAADWWSVGIILFELITGTPPFNARLPEIIFNNILNQKIPWSSVCDAMSNEAEDLIKRLLENDPSQRLGGNGAPEVKRHPFFKGINWDNLALQKAAFVPKLDSADDTSYFKSRYSQSSCGRPDDQMCGDFASNTANLSTNESTRMDECRELIEYDGGSSLDLSLVNFSFKNLSQLASINYDILHQSSKDLSKRSSPSKGEFMATEETSSQRK